MEIDLVSEAIEHPVRDAHPTGLLNVKGASDSLESSCKFDQKSISNGSDFSSSMLWKGAADQFRVPFEELHCKRFTSLGKRSIAHHVGKHYRGKSPFTF